MSNVTDFPAAARGAPKAVPQPPKRESFMELRLRRFAPIMDPALAAMLTDMKAIEPEAFVCRRALLESALILMISEDGIGRALLTIGHAVAQVEERSTFADEGGAA